jgi:hypothetical protein
MDRPFPLYVVVKGPRRGDPMEALHFRKDGSVLCLWTFEGEKCIASFDANQLGVYHANGKQSPA